MIVRQISKDRNLAGKKLVSLFMQAKIYEIIAVTRERMKTNSKTGTPRST